MQTQIPVGYFKDVHSGCILKFEGKYDVEEMRKHKDYVEVTDKEHKEYKAKQVKE